MSSRTRTIASTAAVAVLAGMLVGSLATAGAEESVDGRSTTTGYYVRTATYYCSGDVGCFTPKTIAKCDPGDRATGGAAWLIDNPGGKYADHEGRPWTVNSNPIGWISDADLFIGMNDRVFVRVICADLQ